MTDDLWDHAEKLYRDRKGGRPVGWPQDTIRRAAQEMRENRSSDWLVLARLCLQAAVPDVRTLFDLLPPLNERVRSVRPKDHQ